MDINSLASLTTALNNITTGNDIGTIMLSKQLDLAQTQGEGLIKAMEQSVNPHLGSNFDMYV